MNIFYVPVFDLWDEGEMVRSWWIGFQTMRQEWRWGDSVYSLSSVYSISGQCPLHRNTSSVRRVFFYFEFLLFGCFWFFFFLYVSAFYLFVGFLVFFFLRRGKPKKTKAIESFETAAFRRLFCQQFQWLHARQQWGLVVQLPLLLAGRRFVFLLWTHFD